MYQCKRERWGREVIMTSSCIKAAIVSVSAAVLLAACTDQALPTYGYYSVPCPPTAAGGVTSLPATSANSSAATPALPAGGIGADGTSPPTAASCITAIPNYGYAGQYPSYWNYGWPYDDGFGFE